MKKFVPRMTLLAVGALGLVACTSDVAGGRAHSSHKADGRPVSEANIGNAILDYFFPTSGQDFAAGQTFYLFMHAVVAQSIGQCLIADGFRAATIVPPPYGGDNTEFPDLTYLQRHGFIVTESAQATADPTQGMSATEAAAYRSAERRCSMSGSDLFKPILATGSALQAQWMNIVAQIDASTQFQEALTGWRACMASAGIHVTTIDSFFSYLDRNLKSSLTTGGRSTTQDLHLAALYAHCLGPAEQLRDQLRAQARSSFFNAKAEAINQWSTQANDLVTELEARYSVRWGQ